MANREQRREGYNKQAKPRAASGTGAKPFRGKSDNRGFKGKVVTDRGFKLSDPAKQGEKREFKKTDKPAYKGDFKSPAKPADRGDFKRADKPAYKGDFKRPDKPAYKGDFKRADKPAEKREFKKFDKRVERNEVKKPRFEPTESPKETENDSDFIETIILEGRNAVLEAISAERPIDKIFFKKGEIEGTLKVVLAKARDLGIVTVEAPKEKLDEMSETKRHQGVIAVCPAVPYAEISDMLELAKQKGEDPLIIVLDKVTDPHNLGAIIRTAEVCGAHGVIIPKRRASGMTGVVAKASAGAINHMLCARVNNLNAAIKELKDAGLWICCADAKGDSMYKTNLSGALAVVLGGEGEGVSRLVKDGCDFTASIPMFGKIESLNVSVASGVILYEAVRQRSNSTRNNNI